ncbi:hypothetical protein GIB67_012470 [Kingdonia uniflora]|uniref:50S ribosomal protein L19, chloroplastic n=1 Tax=Kingdonia uniflora TaxID=39325 RepID=A0A7J7MVI3_9MAGN|nr:hypothetical protein GIB67_012470 [Kingdonia uniflora]
MGSKVLTTQALVSIPTQRFSTTNTFLPNLIASFNSNRITVSSKVCSLQLGFKATPLIQNSNRRGPFVARAESEGDVAVSEPEAEAEVEPEVKRKPIIKLGDIMGILNKRAVEASEKERPVPEIRTGDIVQIKLEVPENRRRASLYKGIVISRQNAGIHTTIRIRRIIAGIGVEIVFPLYSPNIKEIKVVGSRKVRRARLYYLRDKLPRLSTFK